MEQNTLLTDLHHMITPYYHTASLKRSPCTTHFPAMHFDLASNCTVVIGVVFKHVAGELDNHLAYPGWAASVQLNLTRRTLLAWKNVPVPSSK